MIPVFYCEQMLAKVEGRSPSAHKPRPVVNAWKDAKLPIQLHGVDPVDEKTLALAHDPTFVDNILQCRMPNGFGVVDPAVSESLRYTSGAMLCAARHALDAGVACAPVSGFHHAGYAYASLFCTFNGLMVTAATLLREARVRRVMILDCDYHFGDGTEDIIGQLQLQSQVENATFGRWYRDVSKARLYLEELRRTVARFADFDLVLYQAGADVHVDDPLGGLLDSGQMRLRDRIVFEVACKARVPLAWNLAGGYQVPLQKVIALHVATMEECVAAYVQGT